jgi:hypothetical protein
MVGADNFQAEWKEFFQQKAEQAESSFKTAQHQMEQKMKQTMKEVEDA